ncbi:MAG: amidohydrolase family protein [Candidatus Limnocylindria bacterium]
MTAHHIRRRDLLRLGAASAAALACQAAVPIPTPTAGTPTPTATSAPDPTASPASPPPRGGVLIRADAFADGRTASPARNVSLLVRDGSVAYLGPRDGEPPTLDPEVVEIAGTTVIPGLVDCHSHFTGPGGLDYLQRLQDPEPVLLARADENARTLVRSGVLAARDVGAVNALNIRIRDDFRGRRDAPIIVAAGTWIGRRGRYVSFAVQVGSAEELLAAAMAQLDLGADLVKIAVDGATRSAATFTADELRPAVEAVHARGKRVAVHAQGFGSRVAAEAGVDTIDHGYTIEPDTAALMRGRTALVTTLSVPVAFNNGTELAYGRASVKTAHDAGVRIATGTDFGGGPPRPGNFALELELLVRAGLEPFEALGAATHVAGEVIGVPGVGTLGVGTAADLVLVEGDILSDIAAAHRVKAVFRDGERVV